MADEIFGYLRRKGYYVNSQKELDELKIYFEDKSHLFFDGVVRTVQQCDENLTREDREEIYTSYIQPVEEFEDSIEPLNTTADDLLKLIQKAENRLCCACITTGTECRQCDLLRLRCEDFTCHSTVDDHGHLHQKLDSEGNPLHVQCTNPHSHLPEAPSASLIKKAQQAHTAILSH
jgi:hypothetical protein